MTRPILHRQVSWAFDDESECLEDMGLYASLAAVTLPDSGNISRCVSELPEAVPFRGTVARKATDLLMWATIVVCFALLASGVL